MSIAKLGPLKSKVYDKRLANIERVHPVISYPTIPSTSADHASCDSDAEHPMNTPVFEFLTLFGSVPESEIQKKGYPRMKTYHATFSIYLEMCIFADE